jgi:DeoR/GlpR family transcriptional regulator of sugar metabolism
MTPRQKQIHSIIHRYGTISRADLSRILGISVNTVGVHLTAMRDQGVIESTGVGHTSKVRIVPPGTEPTRPRRSKINLFANASSIFNVQHDIR